MTDLNVMSNLPLLGQRVEPKGFYIAGKCPYCGNPIFAHAAPDLATCAYKICMCDDGPIALMIPPEYDGKEERRATDLMFQAFSQAREVAMRHLEQVKQLKAENAELAAKLPKEAA